MESLRQRCLDPDTVLKKSWIRIQFVLRGWIRIWIRFVLRVWIRIRSISDRIRNPVYPFSFSDKEILLCQLDCS